jgi:DNA replication factor GINS
MDIVKLREMLEAELSNPELSPIDESFYSDYDSLLKVLRIGAESSRERGESVEEMLYLEQLKIAEGLMREILRIRLHKLVDMAFSGVLSDLVEEERAIFLILKEFIERGEVPLQQVGLPEQAKEELAEEPEPDREAGARNPVSEAYLVSIDLPRIVDEKLREYGPIKAGDIAVLPKSVGEVLLKRGVAQKIRISFSL